MQKIKILSLTSVLLFSSLASWAQPIVSIEELRREGEIGNFLSGSLNLSGSSGTAERENIDFSVAANKNTDGIESLIFINFQERTKNNEIEDEANFLHARLLFKSNKPYNWEFYTQYSENPFQLYKKRNLFGGGVRFKLEQEKRLGISILRENEISLINDREIETDRVNVYFTNALSIQENINFNYSLFFQPSIDAFSDDYKLSALMQIEFLVNENFSINFNLGHTKDTDPPLQANETDTSYGTEFRFNF
ncbi:MAG: DUF481 domain-containing protein [Methylophilaceae bacterium]|nr:DUF481 domain-containing protein [Methylophilaceae bacterium]MBL6791677.1 DUF481 domain-containing protein [Methylophilaceae bacterium]